MSGIYLGTTIILSLSSKFARVVHIGLKLIKRSFLSRFNVFIKQ